MRTGAGAGLRPPARGGAHPRPSRGPQAWAARLRSRPTPAGSAGRSPPPPPPAPLRPPPAAARPALADPLWPRPRRPRPRAAPASRPTFPGFSRFHAGPRSRFRFFCQGSQLRPFAGGHGGCGFKRLSLPLSLSRILHPGFRTSCRAPFAGQKGGARPGPSSSSPSVPPSAQ